MIYTETSLKGAWIITPDLLEDERGYFARTFCTQEMQKHGMESTIVQTSIAFNKVKGTFRGMHYQAMPHEEAKYVQCVRGTIYDIIIDLRQSSPTKGKWYGVELSDANRRILYVPKGFAHGYLTMTDATELHYAMTVAYVSEASKGVRWDDPAFEIRLPAPIAIIADKDSAYPEYRA